MAGNQTFGDIVDMILAAAAQLERTDLHQQGTNAPEIHPVQSVQENAQPLLQHLQLLSNPQNNYLPIPPNEQQSILQNSQATISQDFRRPMDHQIIVQRNQDHQPIPRTTTSQNNQQHILHSDQQSIVQTGHLSNRRRRNQAISQSNHGSILHNTQRSNHLSRRESVPQQFHQSIDQSSHEIIVQKGHRSILHNDKESNLLNRWETVTQDFRQSVDENDRHAIVRTGHQSILRERNQTISQSNHLSILRNQQQSILLNRRGTVPRDFDQCADANDRSTIVQSGQQSILRERNQTISQSNHLSILYDDLQSTLSNRRGTVPRDFDQCADANDRSATIQSGQQSTLWTNHLPISNSQNNQQAVIENNSSVQPIPSTSDVQTKPVIDGRSTNRVREQERRALKREYLDTLRDLLPPHEGRRSEQQTVTDATELILQLRRRQQSLEREIQRQDELQQYLRGLRDDDSNSPPPSN